MPFTAECWRFKHSENLCASRDTHMPGSPHNYDERVHLAPAQFIVCYCHASALFYAYVHISRAASTRASKRADACAETLVKWRVRSIRVFASANETHSNVAHVFNVRV